MLLTKTAHLFYDNHSEHECSLPGQHGHVCWTIVNNLILNSFQSIMAFESEFIPCEFVASPDRSHFNNDTYFCYSVTSYVRSPVQKHQAKWQRHTIFLCYFSLLFNQQAQLFFPLNWKRKSFLPILSKKKYKKCRWFK